MASCKLLLHNSPFPCFNHWLTSFSRALYGRLTATWLHILQVITVVGYIRRSLEHSSASPTYRWISLKLINTPRSRQVSSYSRQRSTHFLYCTHIDANNSYRKSLRWNRDSKKPGNSYSGSVHVASDVMASVRQSWSERVSTCVVSWKSQGISLLSLLVCHSGWSCCWLLLLWPWPTVPPSLWKTWSSTPGNSSLVRLWSVVRYSRCCSGFCEDTA